MDWSLKVGGRSETRSERLSQEAKGLSCRDAYPVRPYLSFASTYERVLLVDWLTSDILQNMASSGIRVQ